MSQERRLQQQLIAEDEQLAALLSKNMRLSEHQQHHKQQQQQPTVSAVTVQTEPIVIDIAHPTSAVAATAGANFSISQHYHHYRPVAQLASDPVPVPVQPASSVPSSSYIQHIVTSSSNPEAALESYHRHLTQMEEQYHQRIQQQQQQQQQYPPSPTGSTASSIQDDHQLQLILLEQHNLAVEAEKLRLVRAQEEEQMLLNQLMYTRDDVMSDNDEDISWGGGQPMPGLAEQQQHPQQPNIMDALKVVYPEQPWVVSGEEDIYGMDDEESPCSIYYSRMANYL